MVKVKKKITRKAIETNRLNPMEGKESRLNVVNIEEGIIG